MSKQKCELCGVTADDCRSWVKCPIAFSPVCHKCHEKCKYLKTLNGYMQICTLTHKLSKA